MTTFEVYRFSLWFYKKNARVLGTNARFWGRTRVRRIYLKRTVLGTQDPVARRARRHTGRAAHILKTQGFGGQTRVRRIYLKRTGFGAQDPGARRARRRTGGAAHILKTQGFWGRTRVRRIYLKRRGFGDECAFVAYT